MSASTCNTHTQQFELHHNHTQVETEREQRKVCCHAVQIMSTALGTENCSQVMLIGYPLTVSEGQQWRVKPRSHFTFHTRANASDWTRKPVQTYFKFKSALWIYITSMCETNRRSKMLTIAPAHVCSTVWRNFTCSKSSVTAALELVRKQTNTCVCDESRITEDRSCDGGFTERRLCVSVPCWLCELQ